MPATQPRKRRNLFEVENARNLTPHEIVSTFVPTQAFGRVLSPKNHVIFGARGSGKTVLAKMLSHDHLRLLKERNARSIIKSAALIGTYVPLKLEWVGALLNKPWQTDAEKEQFFQWRLNLACCLAFAQTAKSCIQSYARTPVARADLEMLLARDLDGAWFGATDVSSVRSIADIEGKLRRLELRRQQAVFKRHVSGLNDAASDALPGNEFDVELFAPIRYGMYALGQALKFGVSTAWLLCLDEAEFLEKSHHRILNSFMRSHSENLFFKLTTMPYRHYTLDTNTGVALDVGHDFDYLYIDFDPALTGDYVVRRSIGGSESDMPFSFARELFNKRAKFSGSRLSRITLDELLGESVLLDSDDGSGWSPDGHLWNLLEKYADKYTRARARKLQRAILDAETEAQKNAAKEAFSSQIGRKIRSTLLLRDAIDRLAGHAVPHVYSGASLAIRCGDGNPRRLVHIYNRMLRSSRDWRRSNTSGIKIKPEVQSQILLRFSSSVLDRVQSEEQVGPDLHRFLSLIGNELNALLHSRPVTTDQYFSLYVNEREFIQYGDLLKRAIGLGLVYPKFARGYAGDLPGGRGVYRLAYILALSFKLLPRLGRVIPLRRVVSDAARDLRPIEPDQISQLTLGV